MKSDLKIFLSKLKHQNYSDSSLNNYKTDVNQFLEWKINENLESLSLRPSFILYKKYLKLNYKNSSYKRKLASINKFLDFEDPQPQFSTPARSIAKKYQLNSILLGSYSLAMIGLLITLPSFLNGSSTNDSTNIPNVNIDSTDYKQFDTKGVKVSISSPGKMNYSAEDVLEFEVESLPKLTNESEVNSQIGGKGVINTNSNSTTIYSEFINDESFIYLVPTSPTNGNVIYLDSQGDGWFKVSIEEQSEKNIEFNWIMINADIYSKLL